MTNINCSSDCVYQKEGKCSFNRVNANVISPSSNCAYFTSTDKNSDNN